VETIYIIVLRKYADRMSSETLDHNNGGNHWNSGKTVSVRILMYRQPEKLRCKEMLTKKMLV